MPLFRAAVQAQTTIYGVPSMTMVDVRGTFATTGTTSESLRIPETTRSPLVTPGDRREPGDGPSSNHRMSLTLLPTDAFGSPNPRPRGSLRSPRATIPSMTTHRYSNGPIAPRRYILSDTAHRPRVDVWPPSRSTASFLPETRPAHSSDFPVTPEFRAYLGPLSRPSTATAMSISAVKRGSA